LEPTKALYNESGVAVDQLELAVDELYNVLTQQKTDRKKIKPQVQAPGSFRLDREIYKTIMHQCKGGDVSFVRSRQGKNVIFFGADYEQLEIKNLYKALNVAKPDLVLV